MSLEALVVTLSISIVALAAAVCLGCGRVVREILRHYPSLSKAAVHRSVFGRVIDGGDGQRLQAAAERMAIDTERFGEAPEDARRIPDPGLGDAARPQHVPHHVWKEALAIAAANGENPVMVAEDLLEAGSERDSYAFPPHGG